MAGVKGIKRRNREAIQFLVEQDSTKLGEFLKEYLQDSEHNGWDGWEDFKRDLGGARALIRDIALGFQFWGPKE